MERGKKIETCNFSEVVKRDVYKCWNQEAVREVQEQGTLINGTKEKGLYSFRSLLGSKEFNIFFDMSTWTIKIEDPNFCEGCFHYTNIAERQRKLQEVKEVVL